MSNKNPIIQQIENAQLKDAIPAFGPGDTVVVQVKVKEGTRERPGGARPDDFGVRPQGHEEADEHR